LKTLTTCIMFVGMAAMSGASFAGANGGKAAGTAGSNVAMLPPLATVSRPSTDEPKIRTIVFSNPPAVVPEEDQPVLAKEAHIPEAAPAAPDVEATVAKITPSVMGGGDAKAEEDPLKMSNEELLAAMLEAEQRLNKAREALVAEQGKAQREKIRQQYAAVRAACSGDPSPECGVGLVGFPDSP